MKHGQRDFRLKRLEEGYFHLIRKSDEPNSPHGGCSVRQMQALNLRSRKLEGWDVWMVTNTDVQFLGSDGNKEGGTLSVQH